MSLRVLVVEDHSDIRALIQSSLSVEGYEVQTAVSLSEARALMQHSPPDVVVLDQGLPDGDGRELVQEVRRHRSTPIIIVSARHQEAQKIELLDAGADDYLAKPFSVAELLARIRVALRHRGTSLAAASHGTSWMTSALIWPRASCRATARCCTSRPPSSTCWRAWSGAPAAW